MCVCFCFDYRKGHLVVFSSKREQRRSPRRRETLGEAKRRGTYARSARFETENKPFLVVLAPWGSGNQSCEARAKRAPSKRSDDRRPRKRGRKNKRHRIKRGFLVSNGCGKRRASRGRDYRLVFRRGRERGWGWRGHAALGWP